MKKPSRKKRSRRRNRARLAGDDAAWRGGGGVPAASAKHMRVFSEHVFPALSRNAAGPACVAARAAAALVARGRARAGGRGDTDGLGQETGSPFEAGVSAEALRLLDVCLLRRDARIAAAFAAAARAAAERGGDPARPPRFSQERT